MAVYILRRCLMMIPTLFGITIISFIVINLAPGSPVEQKLQEIRMGSGRAVGVSQEVIDALNKQYGFDKPLLTRYGIWLGNIAHLDFGESFKYEEPVTELIASKFSVSFMFGVVSLILSYLICVPLGVLKAVRNGSVFDRVTSFLLFVAYSMPSMMLGILLLVFFAGASYFDWFPISGIHSDAYADLTNSGKVFDIIHHAILPLFCYVISGFTFLTLLMKNSMLDVIRLDYIRTAKAKGLVDKSVYMKHALRNALIPVITSMSGFVTVFFTGSLIIEMIFNLDGMGLLTFTAVNSRDYNVLMGLIFFQSVLFMVVRLATDILYVAVDPRIDFT
jgi:microcin C transport system permease protein